AHQAVWIETMAVRRLQSVGLGPVGICIYCGKEPPPNLLKEHLIPRSLRGTITLFEASCESCAQITKQLEEKLTRGPLNDFRIVNNMNARGRRRPASLSQVFTRDETGNETTYDLPKEVHPGIGFLLGFKAPRLLSGHSGRAVHSRVAMFSAQDVDA